jgi:hypothetical protein
MSVIVALKNDVSYWNRWLPKNMCDTNKNVTKMNIVIKGNYCSLSPRLFHFIKISFSVTGFMPYYAETGSSRPLIA